MCKVHFNSPVRVEDRVQGRLITLEALCTTVEDKLL